jgi:hypothetical protein
LIAQVIAAHLSYSEQSKDLKRRVAFVVNIVGKLINLIHKEYALISLQVTPQKVKSIF